jgi:hypothetical protein
MRFRRRAKLFPGVYLNFSKSGISTTIGVRGASVNFTKDGTYLNTGIPGTGIYDRQKIGGGRKLQPNAPALTPTAPTEYVSNEEIGAIRTEEAESTTTSDLQELKKTLLECYDERATLRKEISKAKTDLLFAIILQVISYVLIFGFFIKWFKQNKTEKHEYADDLVTQLEQCHINIDMDIAPEIEAKYKTLLDAYKTLITSDRIWDITSSVSTDRAQTRSAASTTVTRRLVKYDFGNIDIIKSKFDALHFENANGGDLYIYPAFVAIVDGHKKFGLVDMRELYFGFHGQRFLEEEKVPNDAAVVDHTWAKVNKNGSPDKRFKDNYQIPICQYGEIELTSSTGLNEAYQISSYSNTEKFASAMEAYLSTFN